jgi:4-hydroxy-tetrahydrodipicolinate synthase
MNPGFRGLWPALLTPLLACGAIDMPRAVAHARHILDCGADGVTLFGTTGEGPAFSVSERQLLLQALVDSGIRAAQIVPATSATAMPDAITLSAHAAALGCAAALFIPPFTFGQPGDAGVARAVDELIAGVNNPALRVLLYHIPQLSRVAYGMAAIAQIIERHPAQVIGIKDSTGDRLHSLRLVQSFPSLSVLVGNELDIVRNNEAGGAGSICGLANIAPRLMRRIVSAQGRAQVRDQDAMEQLLGLIGSDHFLPVFKTVMAEQHGDDGWRHMRSPMMPPPAPRELEIRQGYRAIASRFPDL